jgi:hypothetical protein
MDTTSLRSAYAALLELARTGEFRPPAQGWDARHVVAHVAANDEMLATTTQSVFSGTTEPYYNHDAIDTARLDQLIGISSGGAGREIGELADWLEQTSNRLCDLLDTLPEDDGALVHAHVQDGDVTVLDQRVPWHRFMTVQASRHLPMHTAQLRALTTTAGGRSTAEG